ncbi:MAG: circadian clock KaiB family protein [Candidatus Thiodiazotropha sp.]
MSSFNGKYHLALYIDSANPKSSGVGDRLRQLCQQHLTNPYTLEIIDLREGPALFEQRRIIAVPTLDIMTPKSRKHRFVGNLSISESLLIAIGMFQDAQEMRRNVDEMEQEIIQMRKKNRTNAQIGNAT